jgi:peptidoglycan hydrolase-like protein with peptidoglycan-binding domain
LAFLFVLVVSAWLIVGTSLAGSSDHGSELWAGQWTTSTGGVAWREFYEEDLQIAKTGKDAPQLFDKLPCKNGPRFYRGGYTAGADRGKIMGCGTPTRMRGRWRSNVGGQFQNGSYEIRISSRNPLTFTGTFRQDDGVTGKYTGTWASHFDGDGCCPDGAPTDDGENAKPTAAVKRLQENLAKLGYYNGPVDGRDSKRITTAVKDFQRNVGIKVDGRCLDICQKALKKMLALYDPAVPAGAEPASRSTVSQLQSDLKKLGFYTGPVDGRNDERVTDAIKQFQQNAGIKVDGNCGKSCQLALVKALTKP